MTKAVGGGPIRRAGRGGLGDSSWRKDKASCCEGQRNEAGTPEGRGCGAGALLSGNLGSVCGLLGSAVLERSLGKGPDGGWPPAAKGQIQCPRGGLAPAESWTVPKSGLPGRPSLPCLQGPSGLRVQHVAASGPEKPGRLSFQQGRGCQGPGLGSGTRERPPGLSLLLDPLFQQGEPLPLHGWASPSLKKRLK